MVDQENQDKLKALKRAMLPEVEIVQMIYVTEQINHPTENFARDLRPKLFKRLRAFTWIEPIHETVNLNPVIFDSDIEIHHCPQRTTAAGILACLSVSLRTRGSV